MAACGTCQCLVRQTGGAPDVIVEGMTVEFINSDKQRVASEVYEIEDGVVARMHERNGMIWIYQD